MVSFVFANLPSQWPLGDEIGEGRALAHRSEDDCFAFASPFDFSVSQRRDEFGQIFNARPLFIRFADRRLHDDGMSRCVHFDAAGSIVCAELSGGEPSI
jgi:hypothetical protein